MSYENRGEVVLTSKTQTPEQLQKVAEDLGYSPSSVEEITDNPVDPPPPADGEAAAETDPSLPASGEPAVVPAADANETAADSDPAKPTTQEMPPAGEKVSRHKRQIQKRDAEIAKLKTDNEARDRELAELRTKVGTPAKPSEPAAAAAEDPVETPRPFAEAEPVYDETKHPTYEAFVKELARYEFRLAGHEKAEADRIASNKTEAEKRRTAEAEARALTEASKQSDEERWNHSISDAKAEFDDWDAVMNAPHPQVPPLVITAVRDRDRGAALAYHLTKHPEEEQKLVAIAKSLPAKANDAQVRRAYALLDRELDRIEALLPTKAAADTDDVLDHFDDEPEFAPVVTPPRAAAPVNNRPPASPKPVPPPAVGARSTASPRSLAALAQDGDSNRRALREIDGSQYRKMREAR